jgi:hypothetical protein
MLGVPRSGLAPILGCCLIAIGAGCAGATTWPAPPDQSQQRDQAPFDAQSWLPDAATLDTLQPDVGPPPCAVSCAGCCDAKDICRAGSADTACGKNGQACADCEDVSSSCKQGVCAACQPACGGKRCGEGDGCGGSCQPGSGCCTPSCGGKNCGDSDGCGGSCAGPCPWKYICSNKSCVCGPYQDFRMHNGTCKPSCGQLLAKLLRGPGACCKTSSCNGAIAGGSSDLTWDCFNCCVTACK